MVKHHVIQQRYLGVEDLMECGRIDTVEHGRESFKQIFLFLAALHSIILS